MLLADLGASVMRIDRRQSIDLGIKRPLRFNPLLRNRSIIGIDLKQAGATDLVLDLVASSDALIEGFRPGVMERLGLGPDVALARNPRLAYGRITGWGQTGPLAQSAGHDLNYIALTGAIAALGREGAPPTVPMSLIGDFGGGALYVAFGLLAAIISARATGKGQVVDAAMAEGALSLQSTFIGLFGAGLWSTQRGTNMTDGGSHFYQVYQCADDQWVSVAAIEERFYLELLEKMGIDPASIGPYNDRANWPRGKAVLAARFREKTRQEWCLLLEGTDACFAPVLDWDEAARHPHFRARQSLCTVEGVLQPNVAPRFSDAEMQPIAPPAEINAENTARAVEAWLGADALERYRAQGVLG
jgi:crotonobetainyl-CoA:carnitine CoA-transferase CaiB-like acyl-CoA transferase